MKRTIVISGDGYLHLKRNQLVLKRDDTMVTVAPLEDIGLLVLESASCSISIPVLQACAEHNTGVVICGRNYMPVMQALPFEGHHQVTGRIREQVGWTEPFKKRAWQQIIQAKIVNQGSILEYLTGSENGFRMMAKKVASGDTQNMEAQASRRYWPLLFGSEFRRQPQGDWPNVMLNYGYSILRSCAARALVGVGLHPSMGLFHKRKDNAYCLADDVMEPFRPYVDWQVRQSFTSIPKNELGKEHKQILFEVLTADTLVEGRRRPLQTAMEDLASSLAQASGGSRPRLRVPEIPDPDMIETEIVDTDES